MSAVADTDTLEPFITVEELRLAIAEPELDEDQAQLLCELGSAAVRAEVNQTINIVENDTVVLDGSGSRLVLLPELEVQDVISVTLGGVGELTGEVQYDWNAAGCLWRLPERRQWPRRPRRVQVTYTHGWAQTSPQWEAARKVALEVASRTFRNPEMLQSERLGSYTRTWVPTGGRAALTDPERSSLDLLRRGV